jgi:ADP-dependent NAD(P)H-hydrate dehydratase
MSSRSEPVTPALLREWGLPDPGDSKKSRGRVMVVGGSTRSPGGVLLAGEAALRVGAGRLGLVVPAPIQLALGVALPEAAVFTLPANATDAMPDPAGAELESADAVLIGPGFDDADETRATILSVAAVGLRCLVLDAFALGVLTDISRGALPASLILNPNAEEAAILLDRDLTEDRAADVAEIARRFEAIVNCYGTIAEPSGRTWQVPDGGPGLGTSGSGDVLAGAIAGFAARGVPETRAAVWGSWVHARAGDRLTDRPGIGFLARDLAGELTDTLAEVTGA